MRPLEFRWPAGHDPAGAAVHAVSSVRSAATPETVWAWLVRPGEWSLFYNNAWLIHHIEGPWPELGPGTRWRWMTFGASVTTEITEYEPFERLAWTGRGLGATGHHAWILEPGEGGTFIHTAETQRGRRPRLLRPVLLPLVQRFNRRWVEGLSDIAESGRRP